MIRRSATNAQSTLDKFVLIAWCGEGVPESRKGLFRTCHAEKSEGRAAEL